jgi:dihydropteroate synthase
MVMAVVNRTPDSFYDRGAAFAEDAARRAISRAVADGADIIDIGGVKAGHGAEVGVDEELARVLPTVVWTRETHPDVLISVDTWRAEVGQAAADAGADLLNDAWGGADPRLAQVAADRGLGLVCSHTGGLPPRTDPFRPRYPDLVEQVVTSLMASAEQAVAHGVPRAGVLIDPTHDFGKNTWHSLALLRHTDRLVATGWPVLMALSNKDFIGETLGVDVNRRREGTLAAIVTSAAAGAAVFRVHDVRMARAAIDTVTLLRPPARSAAPR